MIALVASSLEASLLSGRMIVYPCYFELFRSCDDMPWEFPWFWISNSHLKVLFDHMSLKSNQRKHKQPIRIKEIYERANENSK